MSEQRIKDNLEIIKKLKTANSELSREELNKYSGFGGLREAIYTPAIYKEIKQYLSDEEITSIKATTGNAFYSPAILVKFMWAVLERYIPVKLDNMLEPSAGTGVFLDHIPATMKFNNIEAIELDILTAYILRIKHSQANIICTGFERFYGGNKKYDLIISNPPYGRLKLYDASAIDLQNLCIHHYFIAKSARLLKDNGIIAMIVPSFVLDNIKDHARELIHQAGVNLLLAYRLPDNLFDGATISVDIVFFKKCSIGDKWLNVSYQRISNKRIAINEYYLNNPDHVLGTLAVVPMYERFGLTCKAVGDLKTELTTAFLALKNKQLE